MPIQQFLVVSYDITSTRRRTKVMKTLEGYGTRVQYSVFECRLKAKEVDELRRKLKKLISEKEDSIRFYFISADDVKRIERLGDPRTVDERIFILH